jgi:hypothetical protein
MGLITIRPGSSTEWPTKSVCLLIPLSSPLSSLLVFPCLLGFTLSSLPPDSLAPSSSFTLIAIDQFCSSHTLQEVYIDLFEKLDEALAEFLQKSCDHHNTASTSSPPFLSLLLHRPLPPPFSSTLTAPDQFCSSHTLQEVYIDLFEKLDEALAESLQKSCDHHNTGIDIIAIRVTKPRIPESVKRNYEAIETAKTEFMVQKEKEKVAKAEENIGLMRATIQAQRGKYTSPRSSPPPFCFLPLLFPLPLPLLPSPPSPSSSHPGVREEEL